VPWIDTASTSICSLAVPSIDTVRPILRHFKPHAGSDLIPRRDILIPRFVFFTAPTHELLARSPVTSQPHQVRRYSVACGAKAPPATISGPAIAITNITGVLSGEGTAVGLPNRLNDNPGLAKLVDVAARAWPRMIDRGAAVVIGGLQLQQCPCVASAQVTTGPVSPI